MKTFPEYDIQSTQVRGNKCTVNLVADTACGERIRAKATVRAGKNDSLQRIEDDARTNAYRNLRTEHESVVASCRKRGNHNHGG